jgi:hypothetical protein
MPPRLSGSQAPAWEPIHRGFASNHEEAKPPGRGSQSETGNQETWEAGN